MRKGLYTAVFLVFMGSLLPRTAAAQTGAVDGWLGGQNELLLELIGQHLTEISHLTTIITNTTNLVSTANEGLAMARRARAAYEMLSRYDVDDLVRDAKAGLYRGFPELQALDQEIGLAIANGQAMDRGSDAFFSRIDYHDAKTAAVIKAHFDHGYQAAIWPMVFPEAMKFHPNPSPTEILVQSRYQRTDDMRRLAMQNTAMGVLAGKVKALVNDAEAKDNADLKALAAHTQIDLQNMANSTQMRNLKEQEVAMSEEDSRLDKSFRQRMDLAVDKHAGLLMSTGRRP